MAEGFKCVGFDIVDMCALLGHRRPANCQLVLQDVLTLHGSQFKDAAVIVASPPCQAYSYRAMPWSRAKALPPPDNSLFDACFRIQREASEAAGRYIPLIVENVRGAQKWVGRAAWHFGSYYLWGDVPALMPLALSQKFNPDGTGHPQGSWFAVANSKNRGARSQPVKVPGITFNGPKAVGFVTAAQRFREFRFAQGEGAGVKQHFSGDAWFDNGTAKFSSRGDSRRRRASALIAKIPFPLAQHLARCFKPTEPGRIVACAKREAVGSE